MLKVEVHQKFVLVASGSRLISAGFQLNEAAHIGNFQCAFSPLKIGDNDRRRRITSKDDRAANNVQFYR